MPLHEEPRRHGSLPREDTEKTAVCKLGGELSPKPSRQHPDLRRPSLQTVRKKCPLSRPLVYGIFVTAVSPALHLSRA